MVVMHDLQPEVENQRRRSLRKIWKLLEEDDKTEDISREQNLQRKMKAEVKDSKDILTLLEIVWVKYSTYPLWPAIVW